PALAERTGRVLREAPQLHVDRAWGLAGEGDGALDRASLGSEVHVAAAGEAGDDARLSLGERRQQVRVSRGGCIVGEVGLPGGGHGAGPIEGEAQLHTSL